MSLRNLPLLAFAIALSTTRSAAQGLTNWDVAVVASSENVRPSGKLVGTNLGYGACGAGVTVPDSVTIVGLASGAVHAGATARLDAEGSEQWTDLSLPTDPSFAMPMRVIGVRCKDGKPAQLFVQRGAAYAIAYVDHPSALGTDGFVRARRGGANLPLQWTPRGAGGALAP
jgi:hypothetical protein